MMKIYKIFDKLDVEHFYIGVSIDADRRFAQHKRYSNSIKLQEDILEFGSQDFDMEILFEGSSEEVYSEEMRLIKELNPYYNNLNDIGGKLGESCYGENHYNSKIGINDVIDICVRGVNGETCTSIQRDYPMIKKEHINHIIIGRAWKSVDIPRREAYTKKSRLFYDISKRQASNIRNKVIEDKESLASIVKQYPNIVNIDNVKKILRGEIHPNADDPTWDKIKKKMTAEQVLDVRTLAAKGLTIKEIKDDFYPNRNDRTIRRIINGESHKNKPGPIKGKDY